MTDLSSGVRASSPLISFRRWDALSRVNTDNTKRAAAARIRTGFHLESLQSIANLYTVIRDTNKPADVLSDVSLSCKYTSLPDIYSLSQKKTTQTGYTPVVIASIRGFDGIFDE